MGVQQGAVLCRAFSASGFAGKLAPGYCIAAPLVLNRWAARLLMTQVCRTKSAG